MSASQVPQAFPTLQHPCWASCSLSPQGIRPGVRRHLHPDAPRGRLGTLLFSGPFLRFLWGVGGVLSVSRLCVSLRLTVGLWASVCESACAYAPFLGSSPQSLLKRACRCEGSQLPHQLLPSWRLDSGRVGTNSHPPRRTLEQVGVMILRPFCPGLLEPPLPLLC